MSIAVLREFISKRKQEHETMLSKRTKAAQKASESGFSEPLVEDGTCSSPPEDHRPNKECEAEEDISPEELRNTTEEPNKTTEECNAAGESINISEGKVRRELKPPRVLEVLYNFSVSIYINRDAIWALPFIG